MAVSLVFVCALLCLDSRARGACDPAVAICITQNPSESENVPQSWEIREVEPFGDPYVYMRWTSTSSARATVMEP
jgi:hypothetical protein